MTAIGNGQSRREPARGRRRLVRRLRTLRNLEWFNIPFLLVVLLLTWWDPIAEPTWQRLVAYALFAALLLIGGWYWHLKQLQIVEGRRIESELRVLQKMGVIIPVVLSAASVAMALSWITGVGTTADRAWATGLLVLAWAEYVNYFQYQLMHDTRADLARLTRMKTLRRSWLAVDLSRVEAAPDGRSAWLREEW